MTGKKTLLEKILTAHLADGEYTAGGEIKIRIDQTLCQDATGTMACLELEAMGVPRVKTELSVIYVDHNTQQNGPENQNDHLYLQTVAVAKGAFFSRPGNGICHQVHLERFGVPGKTLLGSDSHTPTCGGLGMVAIGAGGLDVAMAMGGVPFKIKVPKIIGVCLSGELPPWVAAKDVILKLLSILSTKGNVGCAVEYFGPGVATLSVPERATITNMGAELGVTCSVFPSDAMTKAFMKAQGRARQWRAMAADKGAVYDRVIELNLSVLEPLAACPSSPDNIKPVREMEGTTVQQVVIGSCTNSSLKDLMMVAAVLARRPVHPSVSLAIAPGSRQVLEMLARNGGLADMIRGGARILESACGPCIGQGISPASGTVSLRTFNRNFAGRTGTKGDLCYLVSPETAIAAAVTGMFADPRTIGMAHPAWRQPAKFLVDDSMVLPPSAEGAAVEIIRKETIGAPPNCRPFPKDIAGSVLCRLGDKITTDHIMPAGAFLKHRSNIPVYSNYVFNCLNETGKPTFAEKAAAVRDAGKHGVIVAGESYGQGSSREHAAICPMFLGVRVVMALSIERIHAANLINFGILPVIFESRADYERLEEGAFIVASDIPAQLKSGGTTMDCTAYLPDGSQFSFKCRHILAPEELDELLAGGRLNVR